MSFVLTGVISPACVSPVLSLSSELASTLYSSLNCSVSSGAGKLEDIGLVYPVIYPALLILMPAFFKCRLQG